MTLRAVTCSGRANKRWFPEVDLVGGLRQCSTMQRRADVYGASILGNRAAEQASIAKVSVPPKGARMC